MSAAATWAVVLLAATAAALLLPTPVRLPSEAARAAPGEDPPPQGSWRLLAAMGGGFGAWALVGGGVGLLVAGVVAPVLWWWLGRLEPSAVAQRREELVKQLPTAVDLLAACLDAGGAPGPALRTVGAALGGPVAEELARCCHRLDLGGDPGLVWAELAGHPQLTSLGRTFLRSHESGASVAEAVHHLADDLREAARAEVEARARRLEVKVALPLGLCLLPAFVLLGIVPMVAGLFGSLSLP